MCIKNKIEIVQNNYKIRAIPNGNNLSSQKELLFEKVLDIMKTHRRAFARFVLIGHNDKPLVLVTAIWQAVCDPLGPP